VDDICPMVITLLHSKNTVAHMIESNSKYSRAALLRLCVASNCFMCHEKSDYPECAVH